MIRRVMMLRKKKAKRRQKMSEAKELVKLAADSMKNRTLQ